MISGIAIIPLQTLLDGLLILLAVEEEFRLPDHAVGPSQLMEHVEEIDDLLHRIGRPRLLPVPKGCIRDKDLFRWINEDKLVIELHPADLVIGKDAPVEVGFLSVQEGQGFDRLALKGPSSFGKWSSLLLSLIAEFGLRISESNSQ